MRPLKDILEQIRTLKISVDSVDPKRESAESTYWPNKLLLSELYEEAGELYYESRDFILAIKMFWLGFEVVSTESLYEKLGYYRIPSRLPNANPEINTAVQDAELLFYLGLQAQSGIGVAINHRAALYFFELSAQLGNSSAPTVLARYFDFPNIDRKKYIEQIHQAATAGYLRAQYVLSTLAIYGSIPGYASEWSFTAAQGGHAAAQTSQGLHLKNFNSVYAIEWLQKSSQQGDLHSQRALADAYIYGTGVTQDIAMASYWYRKSATDKRYKLLLTNLHLKGECDSPDKEHDNFQDSSYALTYLGYAAAKNLQHLRCQYHWAMSQMTLHFPWVSILHPFYQNNRPELLEFLAKDSFLTQTERDSVLQQLNNYSAPMHKSLLKNELTQLEKWIAGSSDTSSFAEPSLSALLSSRTDAEVLTKLNAMHIIPAAHVFFSLREHYRQKFSLEKDALSRIDFEITQLTTTLNRCDNPHDDYNYWRTRGLLNQKYEQAGDFLLKTGRFLLAIEFYSAGWYWCNTNSLETKLNLNLQRRGNYQLPLVTENDPNYLYLLGLQAQAGIGTPINLQTALTYFQLAADLGDDRAQYCLANLFLHFDNKEKAIRQFYFSAMQDNASAQLRIYKLYDSFEVVDLKGVAGHWLRTAAQNGNADAQHLLWDSMKNTHCEYLYLSFLQKAAQQGKVISQYSLGHYYSSKRTLHQHALPWLLKAAEQNYPEAYLLIGDCFLNGWGCDRNLQTAVHWFTKAANAGCTAAYVELGLAYEFGRGVEQDIDEAKKYFWMARFEDNRRSAHYSNLFSKKIGPTTPEYAKEYRKHHFYQQLKQCQEANPGNLECEYHVMLTEIKTLNDLSIYHEKITALFDSHSVQLIHLILEDDLITEEGRWLLLLSLYQSIQTTKKNLPDILLNKLGDFYFESLPNYIAEPDLQIIFAISAMKLFQQIPDQSSFYINAAESILVLQSWLSDQCLQLDDEVDRRLFRY